MRFVFALALWLGVLSLAPRVAHAQPTPPAPIPDAVDGGAATSEDGGVTPDGSAPTEAPPPEAPPAPAPPPQTPPPPAEPTPPVTTAPVSGPYYQPTVAPTAGAGASGEEAAADPPPETTLGFELAGGLQTRLGDGEDYGYASRAPGGVVFGPGIWLSPARLWSVGLLYRRAGLGTDRSGPGETSLTVHRQQDTLWGAGRAYPWRTDSMGIYVLLELGMSWQHANADGSRVTTEFLRPAETYACSASDGPGFALGGGLGFDVDLEKNLSFVTQLEATAHRHTSEPIDGCAPGSGSVTTIGASIGFAYKLDLAPRAGASTERKHEERRDTELDDD
jgi:hypothetical protein